MVYQTQTHVLIAKNTMMHEKSMVIQMMENVFGSELIVKAKVNVIQRNGRKNKDSTMMKNALVISISGCLI